MHSTSAPSVSDQILWILIQAGVLLIPVDLVVRVAGVRATVCEIVFSLAFVSWIASLVRTHRTVAGKEFFLSMGLLVMASALSVTAAQNKFLAIRETVQFAWILCIFIMVTNVIRETGQAARLAALILVSGAAACLVGVCQYFFLREPVDMLIAQTRVRSMGFYDQPNALGSYLIGASPLLWSLALLDRFPSEIPWKRVGRVFLLGAAFLYGMALAATFSRGSWIGWFAAVTMLGLLLKEKAKRRQLALIVALSVAGALVIFIDYSFQPPGRGRGRSFSNTQRLMLFDAGFRMFRDHPVVGVGSGNYPVKLPEYATPELRESMMMDYDVEKKEFYINPQKKPDIEIVHNIILQVGTETGVLGLASFCFFFGLYMKKAWSSVKKSLTAEGGPLRAAAFAGFAALLVGGMFGWPFTHGVQELLLVDMALVVWVSDSVPSGGP